MALLSLAIFYSFLMGMGRFLLGAHSINQVMFGWFLGAWLAYTWFSLIRDPVHRHVKDLVVCRTNSSMKIYMLIAIGGWILIQTTTLITFLCVKDKKLNAVGLPTDSTAQELAQWDYWVTFSDTGYIGAVLGAYYGLIYQNKKYGG